MERFKWFMSGVFFFLAVFLFGMGGSILILLAMGGLELVMNAFSPIFTLLGR